MFQEIFTHLLQNKLRTSLTGLSVSVGIFLLIFLLGAGNGLIHAFEANSSHFASDVVSIVPGYTSEAYDGLNKNRTIQLDNRDYTNIRIVTQDQVTASAPAFYQGKSTIMLGEHRSTVNLTGIYPIAASLGKITLHAGRFVNDLDIKERRKVIVISTQTAEEFFSVPTRAVGNIVNIDSIAFRVIGVRAKGGDYDPSIAQIPFTTLRTTFNIGATVGNIDLRTSAGENEVDAQHLYHTIRYTVARRHHFNPSDEAALWFNNRAEGAKEQARAMNILRTALWIIGLLTLLSGVVSISNIMLITVKERTHEFGIRKALGAKPWSILRSVLTESIVITLIAGYIGLVTGIAATEWMNHVSGQKAMEIMDMRFYTFLNPTIDLSIAVSALAVLVVAGLTAGFFPARKAVRIKPIEALNTK